MFEEFADVELIDFHNNIPSDYCYGKDLQTVEEYAEYFSLAMKENCRYTVFKGIREHMNIFMQNGEYFEDREHYFIDLSLFPMLKNPDLLESINREGKVLYCKNSDIVF